MLTLISPNFFLHGSHDDDDDDEKFQVDTLAQPCYGSGGQIHCWTRQTASLSSSVMHESSPDHQKTCRLCWHHVMAAMFEFSVPFPPHDAMLAWYMLWPCVCVSVKSRLSTKMAKHRIVLTVLHSGPGFF